MKTPIQPLRFDDQNVLRFTENRIVRDLLKSVEPLGINLNSIAGGSYEQWEHEQLAMLIGYSLGGFADLSYVSDKLYHRAEKKSRKVVSKHEKKMKKQSKESV